MSETVDKWVAGIYSGRLRVAKGHFKKTAKLYRREGGSHADDVDLALGFTSQFYHDTDRLHDTAEEALSALRGREEAERMKLLSRIEWIEGRMDLIDGFDSREPAERRRIVPDVCPSCKELLGGDEVECPTCDRKFPYYT